MKKSLLYLLTLSLFFSLMSCSVFKKNPKLICGNDMDYLPKTEGKIDENENKKGEWKEYHENGYLKSIGKYEKGIKTGKWKYYDEKGNLIKTEKH